MIKETGFKLVVAAYQTGFIAGPPEMRRTEISQKKSKLVIESIHTMNTFSLQMNE